MISFISSNAAVLHFMSPVYSLNFVFSDHLIFVVDKFSVYSAVTEGKSGANEAAFFLFRIDFGHIVVPV